MTEEPKCVRIYQAQSDAPDLDDGVVFQVEERMHTFEDGHEIDVTFSGGMKRILHFWQAMGDLPGYVVRMQYRTAGAYHFNIVGIGHGKYRVAYPDHFKDLLLPWGKRSNAR